MKKWMVALTLSSIAAMQLVHADNVFMERRALVDSFRAAKQAPIEVAFNPGTEQRMDLFFWTTKYWPLANELSRRANRLVSFVPEDNPAVLIRLVKQQRYQWLYTHPNIAVIAQEHGYTPVVKLNRDLEVVFVGPANLKDYNDLKGKKIGVLSNSNDERFGRHFSHIKGMNNTFVTVDHGGYPEILNLLLTGQVGGIAVRREAATRFIAGSGGKLKVLGFAGKAPMAVMLAHHSVSQEELHKFTEAATQLPGSLFAAVGLKFENNEPSMLRFTRDHLKYMRAALRFVEPDYGRSVYDPKTATFREFHEVLGEGIARLKEN